MPVAERSLNPEDASDTDLLWRYMDFPKFLSLLEDRVLFFSNIAFLGDPLEGFLSPGTLKREASSIAAQPAPERDRRQRVLDHNLRVLKTMKDWVCVSCWHKSPSESAAMWSVYAQRAGIAVQTTWGGLKNALLRSAEQVYAQLVDYVDFAEHPFVGGKLDELLTHKRKSFEHEKELRAWVINPGYSEKPGVPVAVDTGILVQRVFLAPGTPAWQRDLALKLLSRYGLGSVEVQHSELDEKPMY